MGEDCGCDRCLMQNLGRSYLAAVTGAMMPPVDELDAAVADLGVSAVELVAIARRVEEERQAGG